ncbi:ABC transporter ATP-binding protein [Ruegeria sp. 2012CJ41-6]|uniref:ABC transporter ATP-binding protein n=1 Tax=Ruegeria spongiae TaxID=2942209 RepID=A0ABT0Q8A5_9RHOB|nr:ABC transporter ATP-binding protein [Ruegeria spongiae]MCL6286085.1 ABC transporter ATP-binding protein [Ruegeria spongiae]
MTQTILDVRDLSIKIGKNLEVVKGLSFSVRKGETVCLVGESGCGKSISALSILRLLPSVASVSGGTIQFDGRDVLALSDAELRKIRGNDITMIFQEPMSSLNPLRTIGFQVAEVLMVHRGLSQSAALEHAERLLETVRISEPRRRLTEYPHQLSGGMRQRVMIAMALACEPRIILADEPTTALDVTIQAQITELMKELQQKFGTAIVLITHDMGLVAENADRVVVMYAGQKVEDAPVVEFFENATHPYSLGLLGSLPQFGTDYSTATKRLKEIPGSVPALNALPAGCPFATRCAHANETCHSTPAPMHQIGDEHSVACWFPHKPEGGVR